ncbi:TatD family hydrolase [Runella sp. MFBS21]|nr:TatD family hydrolase [Runella sp. MFBS21]
MIHDAETVNNVRHQWVSIGIHPWYASATDWQSQVEVVSKIVRSPWVVAIGECGLDRLIEMPLDTQMLVFEAQVALAEQVQKPVIIHCVRAFNELLAWKKRTKLTIPLIVHGFNNNPQIAAQLVQHGFYLSLGAALLKSGSNAQITLTTIPLHRLFLENDDKDISIFSLYEVAAGRLEISISALEAQIWRNFATIIPAVAPFIPYGGIK